MKLNQNISTTHAYGAFIAPWMRVPEFRALVVAGYRGFGRDIKKC